MLLNDIQHISWLAPWQLAYRIDALSAELQREINLQHPLYQQQAISIAKRHDTDDVLFFLPDNLEPFAVVHLTWSGEQEADGWPSFTFYAALDIWITQCMQPDHDEYFAAS